MSERMDQVAADHIETAANILSGLNLEEVGEDGHAVANKLWKIVAYLRARGATRYDRFAGAETRDDGFTRAEIHEAQQWGG